MSRIDFEEEREEKGSGPHKDYKKNLEYSEDFLKKVDKSLLPGMKVYIGDSHGIPRSLLWFVWVPAADVKVGKQASPVFMHKRHEEFKKEVIGTFNGLMRWGEKHRLKAEISIKDTNVIAMYESDGIINF